MIFDSLVAEKSLKDSEQRLKLALTSLRGGVWDWDIKEERIIWSEGLEALHGLAPGTFEGTLEAFGRDIHPDDRGRVLAAIQTSVSSRRDYQIEYRVVAASGEIGWVEARGTLVCDKSGAPERMVGVCMEITERKKAEESQATLLAIVESSVDAIIYEALDGTILTWNEGAERIFGYSAAEMIGKPISALAPEGVNDHQEFLRAAKQGRATQHFETIRRHKQGHLVHVSVSLSPIRNRRGETIGCAKIARDITEERTAKDREVLLAQASKHFATSLDYDVTLKHLVQIATPTLCDWCAAYIVDETGALCRVAVSHADQSRQDFAEDFYHRYPPDANGAGGVYEVFRSGVPQFIQNIYDVMLEQFALDPDHLQAMRSMNFGSAMMVPLEARGHTFGVLTFVTIKPRQLSDQDFACALELGRRGGVAIDHAKLYLDATQAIARYQSELRERQRVEEVLRQSEKIYRAIGEAINYGIWICDPDGRNIYASDSFLRLVGLTQQQCSEFGWGNALHPEDLTPTLAAWQDCVTSEGVWDVVHRFKGVDGKWHPILARGAPIRDEDGAVICWAGINLDLSKQSEIEEELRDAKLAADTASQAKSAFLANMSHEIRTPLGAILGFSELLAAGRFEESHLGPEECISAIKRNGHLLATLIDDILDLSKVEAGKLSVERRPVRLDKLIDDVRATLDLHAVEKGIDLSIAVAHDIPTWIETDDLRLKQVLQNIIGNAIKYTEKGRVRVQVVRASIDAASTTIAFEVTDSGRGLNEAEIGRLFAPFSQADPSMSRKYGGTGLGLILARNLARLLGGDVVLVSSTPNEGSVFLVTIDGGSCLMDQMESKASAKAEPTSKSMEAIQGMRILLVDDSADNRLLISHFLKVAGAKITCAENGKEGFDKATSGSFDAVLMDIQMPIMDGYTALAALRSSGYATPVVALTAHAMREERERSLALGFDDYVCKPVNRAVLIDSLQRLRGPQAPSSGSLSS